MSHVHHTGERPASSAALTAVIVLFALTRLFLLYGLKPWGSDVTIPYTQWMVEDEAAERAGLSRYEWLARRGDSASPEERLPYPPLAWHLMKLPKDLATHDLSAQPTMIEIMRLRHSYGRAYRHLLALLDVATFALLWWAAPRFFPTETARRLAGLLGGYTAATTLLAHLTLDRLDVALNLLVLLATVLLVSRAHWAWAIAALAGAVSFKVVPIVLLPIWIAGSLTARQRLAGVPQQLAAVARRGVWFLIALGAWFLPYVAAWGTGVLGFVDFNVERGLLVESVWANLLMLLEPLGLELWGEFTAGSWALRSGISAALVTVSTILLAAGLAALTLMLYRDTGRRARSAEASGSDSLHLAQRWPAAFGGWILLFFLVSICLSKVFSPQYLLWLAPFLAFAPLPPDTPSRRVYWALVVAIFALTTVIFPYRYSTDIVPAEGPHTPTALGAALLTARNGLLIGVTVWLVKRRWRSTP